MSTLVVGSTGFVGGEIARGLQRRKYPVRGLVRGGASHPKAQGLRDSGIELVEGDLTQPETLYQACLGIETVVSTATSMPTGVNDGLRRVDRDGTLALIAAAERAGVRKFVYISYSGNIREDSPLETAKRDCEKQLLQSGMQAVILRPSYFIEVWLSSMLGFDPLHGLARIYGSGEARISYISASDVADFAVAAATRDDAAKNVVLEMGGPDPISQLDAVTIFEQTLGAKIKVDFVPVEALREQHRSSDPVQKTFAALMLAYTKGDEIPGARAVAAEYGVQPRSIEQYAAGLLSQKAESVA